MPSKLPSTYRAEHEALLRQIYGLVEEVKGAVNCGKSAYRCDDLLRNLGQIVEDAGGDIPFDLDAMIEKASTNGKPKEQPQQADKPELKAVK